MNKLFSIFMIKPTNLPTFICLTCFPHKRLELIYSSNRQQSTMKRFIYQKFQAFICLAIICSFILLLTSAAKCQTTQEERIRGWSSDIDTLLFIMKSQHYVYRSKPFPQELLNAATKLKTEIAEYSDERMLTELERLAFYMHDGHSYILPVSRKIQAFYLPIQFYLFSDGVYIIDADEMNKDLIGSRVIQIHG